MTESARRRWGIVGRAAPEPFTYPDGRPGLSVRLDIQCPDCGVTGVQIIRGTPENESDSEVPCGFCGGVFGRPLNPFLPLDL